MDNQQYQQQTFYPQVNLPVQYNVPPQQQQQYFEQFIQQQQYPQFVQPNFNQQQQFVQPQIIQQEPLRRLNFDSPVTRTKNNIGQVDATTGNLTFTSNSWFFKIMLIITIVYFLAVTSFILFAGVASDNYPIWLYIIPLIFGAILFLDRKYQVIFDDKNHLMIIKGGFRFLPCIPLFSFTRVIRYNDIKDIYNELYFMNKSKIILVTTNDEHIPLLSAKKFYRTSSMGGVHYSQRIVEEMRAHLTSISSNEQ